MKKRMITWEKSLFDALWCAAMILFVCAANVVAQTGIVRQGLPACSAQDKVEVASFTLSPAQPTLGQSVTVKLKIRSKCPAGTADLRVPWEIKKITANNSTRMSSGTETLAPGASKDVTANWTAAVGTNNFHGSVTMTDGGNNDTSDDVVVTVVRLVTQWLEPLKAKAAGVQFKVDTMNTWVSNCSVSMTGLNDGQLGAPDELVMRYVCSSNDDYNNDACIKFLAYHDPTDGYGIFSLKNGWKVKSITGETRQGAWSGTSIPGVTTEGSRSVYIVGIGCARRNGGKFERVVKIQIEGPEGTNPYQ